MGDDGLRTFQAGELGISEPQVEDAIKALSMETRHSINGVLLTPTRIREVWEVPWDLFALTDF